MRESTGQGQLLRCQECNDRPDNCARDADHNDLKALPLRSLLSLLVTRLVDDLDLRLGCLDLPFQPGAHCIKSFVNLVVEVRRRGRAVAAVEVDACRTPMPR